MDHGKMNSANFDDSDVVTEQSSEYQAQLGDQYDTIRTPEGDFQLFPLVIKMEPEDSYNCDVDLHQPIVATQSETDLSTRAAKRVDWQTRTTTKKRRYKCNVCETMFGSESLLKKHELIHNGVMPFKCSVCPKSFTLASSLKIHLKTHAKKPKKSRVDMDVPVDSLHETQINFSDLDESEFAASLVPNQNETILSVEHGNQQETFSTEDNFQIFPVVIKVESVDSEYAGDLVHRPFTITPTQIESDLSARAAKRVAAQTKQSAKKRRYKCNVCETMFGSESLLKKHELIHSANKPFKCSTCPHSFTLASHLKSHSRIHAAEKSKKSAAEALNEQEEEEEESASIGGCFSTSQSNQHPCRPTKKMPDHHRRLLDWLHTKYECRICQ